MPRNPVKEKALPVGIFIIIATTLVVGGAVWIRGLLSRPEYKFTIRYVNPDPIGEGVAVYYRGVQVGRVVDVNLSPDTKSTLVQVGILLPNLQLPDNIEPYIRLEGITGQRYIELEPAKSLDRTSDYIAEGEVIDGAASLTWDRIQEQVSRIAEERTLEKILVSTQKTMTELSEVSTELSGFLKDIRSSANSIAGQLNRTADQVAVAANKFGNFSSSARLAMPRIASAAEDFSQNTSNVNEAMASMGEAANQISMNVDFLGREIRESDLISEWARTSSDIRTATGQFQSTASQFEQTMESVNQELLQSDLFPNLAAATKDIRGGLQSILGDTQPQLPAELNQVNTLLRDIHVSNRSMKQAIRRISKSELPVRQQKDLESLTKLATLIDQTPNTLQWETLAIQKPRVVKHQFQQLSLFGDLMFSALARLRPVFAQSTYSLGPEKKQLLLDMLSLEKSGSELSRYLKQIEANLDRVITQLPKPKPSLFGSLRSTMVQINETAESFDCVAAQLNHILSQRFLGFKLFFGKPGAGFNCGSQVD